MPVQGIISQNRSFIVSNALDLFHYIPSQASRAKAKPERCIPLYPNVERERDRKWERRHNNAIGRKKGGRYHPPMWSDRKGWRYAPWAKRGE
jgi:uncharacterized protein (DUF924 family)